MAEINGIKVQTSRPVIPKIYAYTTPEIKRHDGWTKIGYTEQDNVEDRIKQQTYTADVIANYEWSGNAIFENTNKRFTDKQFHAYLRKLGIQQEEGKEWLHIEPKPAKKHFRDFRENQGIINDLKEISPYTLREEQEKAVTKALEYFNNHESGEFLWNCKPRFGKTLSTYDLCKRLNAENVLIVTNRPAISTSWYSDYAKFLGTKSGFYFVSEDGNLKEKPHVLSREKFDGFKESNRSLKPKCIEFISLQDLKGSMYFGGTFDKLEHVRFTNWDLLVIDEAHEGVDTYKTDRAFNNIRRKNTLHLSGTPFKALASDKFTADAIYNWTYADEQKAKTEWNKEEENPYETLPKLNLFTYQMSEIVKDKIKQGIDINGDVEEYAFDLNEFFKTNESGRFIHDDSVDAFLDALTKQEKFPFSTGELRNELKHTFWLLNRVDSAKALAKKLKNHPVFKDYEIILAAGDGKVGEDDITENTKSYHKVVNAIAENDKTITLSVGQLTTGITIPEWTAVLMLSNVKSPALYMQAAFRAQNGNLFLEPNGEFRRKENAYVFDFDPARTLNIFEKFANDLSPRTTSGRGTEEDHKQNVRELLNFFPVYGEDDEGKMIELDAAKVLRIPRKIRSKEVVKRGFMSNFLFQNISFVFGAPKALENILNQLDKVKENRGSQSQSAEKALEGAEDLQIDENGDVDVPEEMVIGTAKDIFGEKVYEDHSLEEVNDIVSTSVDETTLDEFAKKANDLKNNVQSIVENSVLNPMIEKAQEALEQDLKKAERKQLESDLKGEAHKLVNEVVDNYHQDQRILETKEKEELDNCSSEKEKQDVLNVYSELKKEAMQKMQKDLNHTIESFVETASQKTVKKVEESKQEEKKRSMEDFVKDHLRGFTRTIPSFLMAYGSSITELKNFDLIIPDNVFKEVTGITLADFRFLRDGGEYHNEETGETEYFDGHVFDEIVFNDSIEEFMNLKNKLSNYFDESQKEDIFDYIPPQKTNQIFTPKWIVKKMVNMLEEENPGCFSDPNKTFADLYMKSGLYITEIVKKLFNDENMKQLIPDDTKRLQHIFEKQVYGLAPTEIIYKIATNFILGFDKNLDIYVNNFRQVDALEYAKEGTLQKKIDELFGGDSHE
ncbi:DEAD/DEAH box helicase family protein [Faecalicoccus pleomorphus]|uniref:DEAD/DEAH box helicase family protein n=1 Tax=Faecalicoccus pleomorphus TaxID=1323 RepID=UPI0039F4E28E